MELFELIPISPHWGVVCKCLAYSKAACDPFVYSLLRHQYKKTCRDIVNRLLRRRSLNTSTRRLENGRVRKRGKDDRTRAEEMMEKAEEKEETGETERKCIAKSESNAKGRD